MWPPLVLGKRQFCHQKGRVFEETASPLTTPMVLCGLLSFFWYLPPSLQKGPETCPYDCDGFRTKRGMRRWVSAGLETI